ncbi:MAG: hypothetical protein ABI868_23270 [Acidobacteriota bacterium]
MRTRNEATVAAAGGPGALVPRPSTLDGFIDAVSDREGISLRELEPLGTLLARTENSVYRVIPLEAGSSRVLIQGGRFFPEPTEVRFSGSGFGGSFLKLGWIGLGLRMEVLWQGQRIITSRIRAVHVQPAPAGIAPS